MARYLLAALVAAALGATIGWEPTRAATPDFVAVNRCNGQTIDDASARVREYDRHSPGTSAGSLVARYGAILDVLAVLNEEREILNSVCSSDAQRAPFFAQIAEYAAWALVLEADVAARLNASCPAAAQALPTMMLSDACLALANVVNENGGAVPSQFTDIIPKIQSRAQTVGLTLPPWSETSQYWRDQVHAKGKAAAATCPSPLPSPTPALRQVQGDKRDFENHLQIMPRRWEPVLIT
ncbi:MAG TPA: hypothetical protein VEW74_07315 [Candidatus Nitrosotalea sp.]|nr:hypothetical protein [Candidatus Nitrosotalea sp.]